MDDAGCDHCAAVTGPQPRRSVTPKNALCVQKQSFCLLRMAAPPPPPPIKLAGGKLATPLPKPSAQVTPPDVPRAPAAPPSMLLTELAADGTLTPAVVYACWLQWVGTSRILHKTVSRPNKTAVRSRGLGRKSVSREPQRGSAKDGRKKRRFFLRVFSEDQTALAWRTRIQRSLDCFACSEHAAAAARRCKRWPDSASSTNTRDRPGE